MYNIFDNLNPANLLKANSKVNTLQQTLAARHAPRY
jgi:hypothetical protein